MTNKLNEPMESPQTCAEIIEQMEAITNESVSITKQVSELTDEAVVMSVKGEEVEL